MSTTPAWSYVLLGGGLAFAAAVQPGPLQAFLVSRTAAHGWRQTLPACLAPLLSDGPIAAIAVLVLGRLPAGMQRALQGAGGLLLIYLARQAFLEWRRPTVAGPMRSTPQTVLSAALVNLLNPNPYAAWTLVLGPTLVTAWRHAPGHAVAFIVAFYGTMTLTLAGFIVLAGSARWLGPRRQRALAGISAAVLAALGIYLLVSAVRAA